MKRLAIVFAVLLPLPTEAALKIPPVPKKERASYVVAPLLADLVRAVPPSAGSTSGGTTSPGGADTQVQFNSSGSFAGDADMTFATDTLTITKIISSGTNLFSGTNTFGSAADAANSLNFGAVAGALTFEGSTADAIELSVAVADPTVADKTWTIPNLTGAAHTFADLETAQTFSGQKTFSDTVTMSGGLPGVTIASGIRLDIGTGGIGSLTSRTENTPDTFQAQVNTSNALDVRTLGQAAVDLNNGACGTAQCTDPSIVIHSVSNNTTNFTTLSSYGISGRRIKTLVAATPTEVLRIPIVAEAGTSGMLLYTVYATDGSTPQTRTGRILFNGNNDGGVETCILGTAEELDNTPTGTLTAAITCDGAAAANAISIYINAESSLSETTLESYIQVINVGGVGAPLPQ